jgi:uncharacterized membrane protein
MMFLFHVAYAVGTMAIMMSVFLWIWSKSINSGLGKFFGFIGMIIAIFSLLCTSYYGIKYFLDGDFESPMGMNRAQMQNMQNMQKMMQNNPMMNRMMNNPSNDKMNKQ